MLSTKRLNIEPIHEKDLSFFQTLRNDQDTSYYLTQMTPINEFMQQEWFKNLGLSQTKMYFTIFKSDKVPIGIVRCDEWDQINNSIRIGIDIEKSHRTQGYAEEAYRALIPYLFFKLNIHRIWLLVLEYNAPAIGLYKKLGFTEEGVQKAAVLRDARYHNYIMMSLIATDHEQTA